MYYPCSCENMKWLVDNYKLTMYDDGRWLIKWSEFDRNGIKTNIQTFAIRINYCPFCGKAVN